MAEIPIPSPTKPLTETELRFYYFGFYKALKRYRATILIGWCIVVTGAVGVVLGWNLGRLVGVDMVLAFATSAAGVGLVSQAISSLEAFTRIVIPSAHNGEQHPLVHEVAEIMSDVENGGWWETGAAMRRMEELLSKYGLPPLE